MSTKEQILYSKASVPPKMERLLARPRINALMEEALQQPLTIVMAGAGFGKTQAVSSVLDNETYNVIWLQLSELDNLCTRLWERFIFAYRPYGEELANSLEALGFPSTAQAFDQYLHLVAEKIKEDKKWVFVLDDFQFIHEPEILHFVERFTFAQMQNLSLVIISRTPPNVSVEGMMGRGLLTRITEQELRFTQAEMEAYFATLGLVLSIQQNSEVYSHTEGWVIAIYLMSLSLQHASRLETGLPAAVRSDIFRLLEKEVFRASSAALQTLLIKVSLLDNLPMEVVRQLAGDDPALVTELMHINLLVRDDSFVNTYRIHHLLQEFLATKQDSLLPEEKNETYMAAARWFEANGSCIDAIQYYKLGSHYYEIFDIILSYNNRVPGEIANLFINLIEEAPPAVIAACPIMLVVRAKFLVNNNRIAQAHAELTDLRKKYEALPPTEENLAVLGEVYIQLGILCFVIKTLDFPALFKMADQCLPKGSVIVNHELMLVGGANFCIIKQHGPGELQKLQDAFFEAIPYASRVMNGCSYGLDYLVAGESAYVTGDLKTAEENAYQAIYRAQQKQQLDIEFSAYHLLMRINICRGKYTKIVEMLAELKAKEIHVSQCISMYDIIEASFFLVLKRTDQFAKWILLETREEDKDAPVSFGKDPAMRCMCYLLEERYYEMLALAEQMKPVYEARGVLLAVISFQAIIAVGQYNLGNQAAAMETLSAAYELSHPNNIIMPFIEFGSKMRSLIYAAQQDKSCQIPQEWLALVYTKSSTHAKRQAQILGDYNIAMGLNVPVNLSKREMEVLTDLCRGLTREEISESCGLSVNTIKSMLQNMYSKLGATNSIDAVHIATRLGII